MFNESYYNYKEEVERAKNDVRKYSDVSYMESKEKRAERESKLKDSKMELNNLIKQGEENFNKQAALNGDSNDLDDLYYTIQMAKDLL